MKQLVVIIALILITADVGHSEPEAEAAGEWSVFTADFEQKMISSGNNSPQFRVSEDSLIELIVLLHLRKPLEEIKTLLSWDDSTTQARLALLQERDFVKKTPDGTYFPTCMVITRKDGETLYATTGDIAQRVAALVRGALPEVKKIYADIAAFENLPFEESSLLLLSNVLLDNWQIGSFEQEFLGAARTPRHGMNYYYSLQEKHSSGIKEAFGIFGNQMATYGKVMVGLYGNNRNSQETFLNISQEKLVRGIVMTQGDNGLALKTTLLTQLVSFNSDPTAEIDNMALAGFERLKIVQDGRITIPILYEADALSLNAMAALISEDLIALLEEYRDELTGWYNQSGYSDEVSFEEYAIWWYHFLYSDATEILMREGLITMPPTGVAMYLYVN